MRENLRTRSRQQTLAELVNESITDTLSRSIFTSLTTFFMVFALFIFGVSSVKEFALPIMIGIVCGAYSSICLAGSIWYVMRNKSYVAATASGSSNSKKSGSGGNNNKPQSAKKKDDYSNLSKRERKERRRREEEAKNRAKITV